MSRNTRAAALITTIVLAISAVPVPAGAWSNGTEGCDSYGTHDWILDQALQAVGEQADWVRTGVALRATDDPDCVDGIDHASGSWWHVYDRWGSEWGGADEAAAVWFKRTKNRVAKGRYKAASKALGYLAHIVGDIGNPMHTDSSAKEEDIHSSYERAVDTRISDYRFNYNGPDAAKPGPRVRRLAGVSHQSYWDLVNAYDRHGYNDKVHRITKRQLNRATNVVADLITSMGSG